MENSNYKDEMRGPFAALRMTSFGRLNVRSGFGAELGEHGFGGRLGVEDVGGGEPGAAELGDAEANLIELFGGVGVGVDDNFAAVLSGEAEVEVVEVGAGGVGVV